MENQSKERIQANINNALTESANKNPQKSNDQIDPQKLVEEYFGANRIPDSNIVK